MTSITTILGVAYPESEASGIDLGSAFEGETDSVANKDDDPVVTSAVLLWTGSPCLARRISRRKSFFIRCRPSCVCAHLR